MFLPKNTAHEGKQPERSQGQHAATGHAAG